MLLGYNTNGFAHHRLTDCIDVLADLGYSSIALTLDHQHLDPFAADWRAAARSVRRHLEARGMYATVETGARFILDPRRKHQPTLVSATPTDRRRRFAFLCRAVDIAAELHATVVSLWSGRADDEADETVLIERLCHSLVPLAERARPAGVRLALEPEPGMFVDRMARFERVLAALPAAISETVGLTLDVGHVHSLADGEPAEHIQRWRDRLWNVHIEDMRRGVHEHLLFGEGEMDFDPIVAALRAIGYSGPLNVELSRYSHDAIETARRAYAFLETRFAKSPAAV